VTETPVVAAHVDAIGAINPPRFDNPRHGVLLSRSEQRHFHLGDFRAEPLDRLDHIL